MSSILNFVTILLALYFAQDADATTGHCPKNHVCTCNFLPAMKKFNINNYLGTWYEIRRKVKVGEDNPKCVSFISTSEESDDDDEITISGVLTELDKINGVWTTVKVPNNATQVEKNAGRFLRTFPEPFQSQDGEYLVLHTDYDSFSVVARCVNVDARTDAVLAWIYTRTPIPDESVLEKSFAAAVKFGLRPTHFHKIFQKNCSPSLVT